MFNFLKDKLKGWFKSSSKKAKEEEENIAKAKEIKQKKAKKQKDKEETAKKEQRKKEERKELEKLQKKIDKEKSKKEERRVSEEVIEDIKKEKGTEEIIAVPRHEEIIKELKEEIEEKPKKTWFSRVFSRKYIISESEFSEMFENLELILLENNVALEVVDCLRENLSKELVDKEVDKDKIEEEIKKALKNSIESLFAPGFDIIQKIKEKQPFVIAFFGINGSGKTTNIAKLAYKLKNNRVSCVLAAADTFRAASIEQLKIHGEKLGVPVISQAYGSDPASVAYDAIEYAKAHKIQCVLIDTAGRMHTKENLIKEMGKIVRVSKPDLKIFVGEAITGNDATEQAKTFNEAINIDGIILSKQDIDEKGGTSLSVSYITKKPILYLGVGQNLADLKEFNKEELIKALGL
ncbi:MAG: signal recognition particle-docking protein FtsY [Nanoarchaeota archaeon]|nr:signal recognition particle-docking protein FtsY [Nanoarchaeota archaeon]